MCVPGSKSYFPPTSTRVFVLKVYRCNKCLVKSLALCITHLQMKDGPHKVLPWTPRELSLNVPAKTQVLSSIYNKHKDLLLKRKIKDDHFPIAYSWATYQNQFIISSVQSLSHVWPFVTPWTATCQASLSIINSWSLLKLMPIESVMPSNHLILCRPLLLLSSIFPSVRVFSSESGLHIRWSKYWSFSFSISPPNEYSGLISFRMDSLLEWLLAKRSQMVSVGKDVEKREPSYTVSGNVNWYNHYRKQYGGC